MTKIADNIHYFLFLFNQLTYLYTTYSIANNSQTMPKNWPKYNHVQLCITSEPCADTPEFCSAMLLVPSSLLTEHCRSNSGCTLDTMISFSDSCDCSLHL